MNSVRESVQSLLRAVKQWLRQWTRPDNHSLFFNVALDLTRPKSELVLENDLLRQQLVVLKRQSKRPVIVGRGLSTPAATSEPRVMVSRSRGS